MKTKKTFKLGCGALIMAICASAAAPALSQPGDVASAGAQTSASGVTTAKSARQANRALQKRIYAAIAQDREIDAGSISIKANGGAVAINGSVTDAAQIDKVTAIVQAVQGVTSVTTKLSVQRPLGQ
jgi:hyperosmotically inducible periplasmic protein